MGDRCNFVIADRVGGRVYLYSHWGGYDAPETLREALARRQRWDHPAYLARIIFCTMIANGDDLKGETGYGISTRIQDNEYPLLIVDTKAQQIRLEAEPDGSHAPSEEAKVFTFDEYAGLSEASWAILDPASAREDAD
jgi:hypothetical protein